MLRLLLDSNAVDGLEPFATDLREAVVDERCEVLWTHVSHDEISATPDVERRARLLALAETIAVQVATSNAVFGLSRYDLARFGGEDQATFERLRGSGRKHTRDALIADTARHEAATLITNDARLAKAAKREQVRVMTTAELQAWLRCIAEDPAVQT